MGIFPATPRIALRIPTTIRAGGSFVAEVEIDTRAPVELEWIDIRLRTTEEWGLGNSADGEGRRETLLAMDGRLFSGGVLPAGPQVLRAHFDLPPETPPSMQVASARVETVIEVQASIPWWPDARATFTIPVRGAPRALETAPYLATNSSTRRDLPRIELSLASRAVAARGVLSGAVAFFHHDPRALGGARIALCASTRLSSMAGNVRSSRATAYTIALPEELPGDGTPVPFRMRLPEEMPPSFTSRAVALDWELAIERPGRLSVDTWLAVPIEVVETGDVADPGAQLEVLPVGDARLDAMLGAVASSLALSRDGDSLTGAEGDVRFRIRRALGAGPGSTLEAEIVLPPLGLGLEIERHSSLTRLLPVGVTVGDEHFDAAYVVRARDPSQARAFLTGELTTLLADGSLVRLDDERASIALPDPTLDTLSLTAFAGWVRSLARALDAAIARIPPPRGLVADPEAWAEVARTLGGRARLGDLSVSGHVGESEVEIETSLAAREHVIRVRPSPPLPRELELQMHDPRDAPPRALAEALLALPEGACALVIANGHAVVRLRLSRDEAGAETDPRAALRAASVLSRLGALLAPARGPFR